MSGVDAAPLGVGWRCAGNAALGMQLDIGDEHDVGRARSLVRELLRSRGWEPDRVDVVCLVLSELVANALTHGGGLLGVSIDADVQLAHVVVADRSVASPVVLASSPTRLRGRGMYLVDRLSERWGIDPAGAGEGKQVWAEVAHDPDGRPGT